ncbi:MAG: hypothetical protein NTY66_00235 [Candidatus Vogelbacteria bacterium]|nr:hypothetical protein [Candidatus Vogelbacteria bacterium]
MNKQAQNEAKPDKKTGSNFTETNLDEEVFLATQLYARRLYTGNTFALPNGHGHRATSKKS